MVRKLKIFQSLEDLVKQPVEIYRGPVHKIYADEFRLVKGNFGYKKIDEITKRDAYFYKSGYDFICLDNNEKLPNKDEAIKYCSNIVDGKKRTIIQMLADPNTTPKNLQRFLNEVMDESSCVYSDSSEIRFERKMPGKEFRELIKKMDKK